MERLWTKPFILMTVGMFFLFTGFYSLYPTLPLFIKQMGGNETQVGLAAGAFMLTAVIFRPIVGVLLDRFGRRPFIVWGLLLFTLGMYMYDWIGGIFVLMVLRMLHGMSWAVSTTAVYTAIADMIPSARRGEGMGWFGTATTMAMAVGPIFGIWVTQNLSYHALFLFAVLLSAAALLLTFGAKMPFRPKSGARRIEFFEKSVLPVTASCFFHAIAYGGITTFVPLFANSIKVNPGAFFLAYAATLALIRPIAGKLSDRHGETYVIVPALVITISALITLSFSTGLFGVLVSAVLYGIGFGSVHPALQAATIRLAHPDRKGVATASLLTATDLGIGLGAIMLGWVSQYTSYQLLFTVSAVSVAFSLLLFTFFVKRLLKNKGLSPLNTGTLPSETN
ncbi:MFS family permease [Paenibacillus sp. V4I3]|uniref:MFS transporter n=1 Tax=unclassified Paenibacillus TaxID=185978 RepID=UPI0027813478|nr:MULTISPECIES: MFS transporter [unclassified Paenibacillus]MDQ0878628.1 MFS family permease [Paenibacillus sp. V4I3]MDQ0885514.1 MFS family permease [Paenibacillus sp. V4I9]